MTNKQPVGAIEQRLMKKENWSMASSVDCYWHEDECRCDLCGKKISGRHMIDGKRGETYEFALMCPSCHRSEGGKFGDGIGQLYSRTSDKRWLLTFGFTDDQLAEFGDEDDDDDSDF